MKRIVMINAMNKTERTGPSSDLLRTFLVVADLKSVTAAAEELGRTQSAISVQIRKLEQHFGLSLFDRKARGVDLTEAGQRLLPAARRALREVDSVGALFDTVLTGTIRVGLPDDYGETILERVLADFSAQHPEVEVFARSGCTAGFPDAIRTGDLDVAVYTAGTAKTAPVFFSEPSVWVAAEAFRLAPEDPVPLALFDRNCWWRTVPTDLLDKAGRVWRIAYLSENYTSVKAAISAGLGIGILAESTVSPGMRVVEGLPVPPRSNLTILKGNRPEDPAVQAMESAIRAAIPA